VQPFIRLETATASASAIATTLSVPGFGAQSNSLSFAVQPLSDQEVFQGAMATTANVILTMRLLDPTSNDLSTKTQDSLMATLVGSPQAGSLANATTFGTDHGVGVVLQFQSNSAATIIRYQQSQSALNLVAQLLALVGGCVTVSKLLLVLGNQVGTCGQGNNKTSRSSKVEMTDAASTQEEQV